MPNWRAAMIDKIHNNARLRDLLRMIRVEDYLTFVQLVIGLVLAGCEDWGYLVNTLLILAPCIHGGLYALNDAHEAEADSLHPIKCTRPIAAGRISHQAASQLGTGLIGVGVGAALFADS